MKNKSTPQIRFIGYLEDWEVHALKEVAQRVTRKNANLESTLPLTISAQYGLVDQITYFNNRVASRDISNYYLMKKGEFAYNKSYSEGFPYGVIKCLTQYDMGVLSTLYIVFMLNNNVIDSNFLETYYETNNWHQEIAQRAAEGARNHGLLNISPEDFFETKINYAPNHNEQTKIGEFFKTLDSLIDRNQRKCEKLANVKKAMLQKMFPREGAKVPEIRFKGFDGDWTECEFDKMFNTKIKTNSLSRIMLTDAPTKIINIHYGDVLIKFGETTDPQLQSVPFIIQDDISIYYNQFLKCGDVIFADAAEDETVGKATEIVNIANKLVVAGLHTIVARPQEEFACGYLGYYFNSYSYHNKLIRLMQGTKVLSISKSTLSNTQIIYPKNIAEQTKIGEFFKTLDNLIASNKKELEKLKNIKKALLQRMFV